MSLIRFIFSKSFVKNVVIAIVVVAAIIYGIFIALSTYTKHGEVIFVPNFKGAKISQLDSVFKGTKLRYMIIDSLYQTELPKGIVLDQNPDPDSKVKDNRTIYLTINALQAKQVKMPNLIDLSLKQAKEYLISKELKLGDAIYVPNPYKDAVLGQQFEGNPIKPNDLIEINSKVDLLVGNGNANIRIYPPYIINLTIAQADSVISANSLSMGAIIPDKTIKEDTAHAKIFMQKPAFDGKTMIKVGEPIDIFITMDTNSIKVNPSYYALSDSLNKKILFTSPDTNANDSID